MRFPMDSPWETKRPAGEEREVALVNYTLRFVAGKETGSRKPGYDEASNVLTVYDREEAHRYLRAARDVEVSECVPDFAGFAEFAGECGKEVHVIGGAIPRGE